MKAKLPNLITTFRIIATLCLTFVKPFGKLFFAIYIFAGVTDVLDGTVARIMNQTSEFGARLDSIADIIFYAIMFVKIMPRLHMQLSSLIWIMIIVSVTIRLTSYFVVALKYRKFASLHTYMNKLTGFTVFLVPFIYFLPCKMALYFLICIIATLASLEELAIHVFATKYVPNRKSFFF